MTSVDLVALPDISFAPMDTGRVEADVIASFESAMNITLYPSTPERLLCESLAYREIVINGNIDLAVRQNLLAFAAGGHLDHLGAFMGTTRLAPTPSRTTLRFSLPEALTFAVDIPAGTRVATTGGQVMFATQAVAVIPAGETEVEVDAACLSPGAQGNGFVAGQMTELVDRIACIGAVSNVAVSLGGSDVESDAHYRERIRLASEAFSNAGSEGAYRFWAMSAHADIADVSITSPSPGVVDVRPILLGGEMPDAEHLRLVAETLSSEFVRPLKDHVLVAPPDVIEYTVDGLYYLARSGAALADATRANIASALEKYRVWQRSKPGRDINPTKLISLLEQAGAKRVEVSTRAFRPMDAVEVARETAFSLRFGGYEDD
ncbi:baseplate J/gp47 family protein [Desulfovibrio sp. ZJ369]|uniref:baseplate assembly protein n=1 Tax=Desulfovibrio sp. ZJ369 TaxID=2709793 RepID=UPI0013E9AEBE|nr:baseplate J/gp47 family protein [Desulfovibrio sp. ZJ369]